MVSYHINVSERGRDNQPLRKIHEVVDFQFVRAEVAHLYGYDGNESVPPENILKMMFLLFFDDLPSERELMRIIPERLDYLWFLGCELDDPIPDPSVLSKARRRWGPEAFERFFRQNKNLFGQHARYEAAAGPCGFLRARRACFRRAVPV